MLKSYFQVSALSHTWPSLKVNSVHYGSACLKSTKKSGNYRRVTECTGPSFRSSSMQIMSMDYVALTWFQAQCVRHQKQILLYIYIRIVRHKLSCISFYLNIIWPDLCTSGISCCVTSSNANLWISDKSFTLSLTEEHTQSKLYSCYLWNSINNKVEWKCSQSGVNPTDYNKHLQYNKIYTNTFDNSFVKNWSGCTHVVEVFLMWHKKEVEVTWSVNVDCQQILIYAPKPFCCTFDIRYERDNSLKKSPIVLLLYM